MDEIERRVILKAFLGIDNDDFIITEVPRDVTIWKDAKGGKTIIELYRLTSKGRTLEFSAGFSKATNTVFVTAILIQNAKIQPNF